MKGKTMCECIEKMNEALRAKGSELVQGFSLEGGESLLYVETTKLDSAKRGTRLTKAIASCCPFCGAGRDGQQTAAETMRSDFNAAIDFAVELGPIGVDFLVLWREGSWDVIAVEFPEFKRPASAEPTNGD